MTLAYLSGRLHIAENVHAQFLFFFLEAFEARGPSEVGVSAERQYASLWHGLALVQSPLNTPEQKPITPANPLELRDGINMHHAPFTL